MSRIKYGIDLGTTNSSIATITDGEPVIFKTDTKSPVMPSCVSFSKRKITKVGTPALNDYYSEKKNATVNWVKTKSNAFVEFKREMGSDTLFESTNMKCSFSAVDLSSEVLKKLKTFIPEEAKDIVITVPAKFTVNQKAATITAAEKAGFRCCELLQEPLAASFAYGISTHFQNGIWLVFDFGGGTFDAALVQANDGVMQIFDTEGDSFLGGKDLDLAIVEKIIIPYINLNYSIREILISESRCSILKESLKIYAEKIRKELSLSESFEYVSDLGDIGIDDDGEEIVIDHVFTREEVYKAIDDLYQKAVDMCIDLLARNNIKKDIIDRIILVGGPTHCPLIREKLKKQISEKLDCSIDPMTAVAVGAALYAQSFDVPDEDDSEEADNKDALKLEVVYQSNSINDTEWVGLKPAATDTYPDGLEIELSRTDNAWSSGRIKLGDDGEAVEVLLERNRSNTFKIIGYDSHGNLIKISPNSININQGVKLSGAVLPYNICYSYKNPYALYTVTSTNLVASFSGLEKNNPLPAVGKNDDRRVSKFIEAGSDSFMTIPIFQADHTIRDESFSLCYEHVTDIVISGKELSSNIYPDDPVHLTLKVNTSEMMELEAYFPKQNITVAKSLHINTELSSEEAEETFWVISYRIQQIIKEMAEAKVPVKAIERRHDDVIELMEKYVCGDKSLEVRAILQQIRQILVLVDSHYLKNERILLKHFFETIKNKRVDRDSEKLWKSNYLTRLPKTEDIEEGDIKNLRALKSFFVSSYKALAPLVINANVFMGWYFSDLYISFDNSDEIGPLLEKLHDIGFDNYNHPDFWKLVSEITDIAPQEFSEGRQGYLK